MTYNDPDSMFAVSAAWVSAVGAVKIIVTNASSIQPEAWGEVNQSQCILHGEAFACTKVTGLDDFMHMRVSTEKHIICCTVGLHTQPVLTSAPTQSVSQSFGTLRHGIGDNSVAASPPSRKPGSLSPTTLNRWDRSKDW